VPRHAVEHILQFLSEHHEIVPPGANADPVQEPLYSELAGGTT
jgi:hypothetical protein